MQLIGMLDSPYVRRVAISFQLLGLSFEHRSLSVFRNVDEFQAINPLVKAPTLVCDDGQVLMDSTLILAYGEALAQPRRLLPQPLPDLQQALRVVGLALVACDKSVQIIYERSLRPPEKAHAPWIDRVTAQLRAAYDALEAEIIQHPLAAAPDTITQAGISTAVAWRFTQATLPELVPVAPYPALAAYGTISEATPPFRTAPYGDATYPASL